MGRRARGARGREQGSQQGDRVSRSHQDSEVICAAIRRIGATRRCDRIGLQFARRPQAPPSCRPKPPHFPAPPRSRSWRRPLRRASIARCPAVEHSRDRPPARRPWLRAARAAAVAPPRAARAAAVVRSRPEPERAAAAGARSGVPSSTAPRSSVHGAERWTRVAARPAGARRVRAPVIARISSAGRGRRLRRTACNRR